jgi:hypothetical protein
MDSEITQLIAALRSGTMNLEQVAQRFREREWPRRNTAPGSFDEVDAAYEQGKLSEDEYDTLAAAMSESLRAEDRRKR